MMAQTTPSCLLSVLKTTVVLLRFQETLSHTPGTGGSGAGGLQAPKHDQAALRRTRLVCPSRVSREEEVSRQAGNFGGKEGISGEGRKFKIKKKRDMSMVKTMFSYLLGWKKRFTNVAET